MSSYNDDSSFCSHKSFESDEYSIDVKDRSVGQMDTSKVEVMITQNTEIRQINHDFNDQIFKRCLQESEFQNSQFCNVCTVKQGILSKFKHCNFCGKTTCKKDLKRKRKDPNTGKFKEICDNCNSRYINKMIFEDLMIKKSRLENILSAQQRNLEFQHQELDQKKSQYNTYNIQKKRYQSQLQDKVKSHEQEYDYEKRNLDFKDKQIESKKTTIQNNIQNIGQKEEDIKQMKYQNLEVVQQMEALEKKIQVDDLKIKSLESKLESEQKKMKNPKDDILSLTKSIQVNESMPISNSYQIKHYQIQDGPMKQTHSINANLGNNTKENKICQACIMF